MDFSFSQNIKSGLFWFGLFKAVGQFFIWANTIFIARFLSPADYGLVGMATLITDFIMLIGNCGFGDSVIQKKEIQKNHLYSLFWITFCIGIFFSIFLYLIAPTVVVFFNNNKVTPLLRLSAVALFFNVVSDIPISLLLKESQYKFAGFTDFTSNLIASISVLIFAILGFGAYSLVYGSIIIGMLRFSLACKLGRWFPRIVFQKQGLHGYFKYGSAIIANRVLWYAYSNSDYLILAKKLGQVAFGFYSFAFNFACIPTNKLQPIISPVLFSSFSKIQDDLPQVREQFLKIVYTVFMFYAIIYCGIFWVISEFVIIFLGAKWEPIILILQILLLVQPLRAISTLSPSLINALGKPQIGVKNMLVFISIMIPGFLIGSIWGMIGVALIWCIAYPVAFLLVLLNNLRVAEIPLKHYLWQLFPGLRIAFIVSLILYGFKTIIPYLPFTTDTNIVWINFTGTIIVGAITNLLILWFFDRNFLNIIMKLVRK